MKLNELNAAVKYENREFSIGRLLSLENEIAEDEKEFWHWICTSWDNFLQKLNFAVKDFGEFVEGEKFQLAQNVYQFKRKLNTKKPSIKLEFNYMNIITLCLVDMKDFHLPYCRQFKKFSDFFSNEDEVIEEIIEAVKAYAKT